MAMAIGKRLTAVSVTEALSAAEPDDLGFPSGSCDQPAAVSAARHLVISPYTGPEHLLDLDRLELPHQLLARAMTHFAAVRPDYATSPYVQTFNFDTVVRHLRALVASAGCTWARKEYYVVAFRSRVKVETDAALLGALDEKSFTEAVQGGGLLKYWFGVPDKDRRNLATCFWRAREDASSGGSGDSHRKAARLTKGLYDEWDIEQLKLVIHDGAQHWEILD